MGAERLNDAARARTIPKERIGLNGQRRARIEDPTQALPAAARWIKRADTPAYSIAPHFGLAGDGKKLWKGMVFRCTMKGKGAIGSR